MGGWRRLLPLVRHRFGRYADLNGCNDAASRLSCARCSTFHAEEAAFPLWRQAEVVPSALRRTQRLVVSARGFCSEGNVFLRADGESEEPVRSPLSRAPEPLEEQGKPPSAHNFAKAVLSHVRISAKKVNLVAALVRGMRCSDALMQMQVLPKRAAKVVYKVVHSARANAINNHGLEKDRLVVSEAFVGTGTAIKRIAIQGKNRRGRMKRHRCNLTVILKEMSAEQEAEMARVMVMRTNKSRSVKSTLLPHILRETRWARLQAERKAERSRVPPSFSRPKPGLSLPVQERPTPTRFARLKWSPATTQPVCGNP